MPVPARRVSPRTVPVETVAVPRPQTVALYARVSTRGTQLSGPLGGSRTVPIVFNC